MPSHHATLGPSGASRWLRCPASIAMSQKVPKQPSSPHATEGTIAHELGEIRAGEYFGLIDAATFRKKMQQWERMFRKEYDDDEPRRLEMNSYIDSYIALIEERLGVVEESSLLLEQRLETGVPGCWGTSDVVIFSPEHVEIIDLKYGTGVAVSPVWNPQMMLYGCGALEAYGDILGTTEYVRTTVFQPRIGNVASFEIASADLRAWRDWHVSPLAEEALSDNARFGPSEEACRWCPAAGVCRARAEANLQQDFGADLTTITPEELAGYFRRMPEFKAWTKAVEASALERAYSGGEKLPGLKVVQSGGRRAIAAEVQAAAIQDLIEAGYPAEKVSSISTRPLGALQKLVGGKDELERIIGRYIEKSPGRPSLVDESDKRESITREADAKNDFAE